MYYFLQKKRNNFLDYLVKMQCYNFQMVHLVSKVQLGTYYAQMISSIQTVVIIFTQQIFEFLLLHNMVKLNFNLIHRSHFYLRPLMTVTIGYPVKKVVFGFLIFIIVFILAELSSRGAKQR